MSLIASLVLCAAAAPALSAPAPSKEAAQFASALKKDVPEELIKKLYHFRGQTQQQVIDELVRRGAEADKPLLDEMPRHESSMMMIYARKGTAALPRLIALIKDPQYRFAAGKALINAANPKGKDHAKALLQCVKDFPAFQYCGMGLVKVMSPESAGFAPKLAAELSNKNSLVRVFAATALGQIGPKAAPAVPGLMKSLGDHDPNVTWAAAAALGKIGRAAKLAVPNLQQAEAGLDPELKREAREALKRIRG